MKVAFISSLFIGTQFKTPDTPGHFDKMENIDYLLFTNIDSDKFNTSWSIVNIDFEDFSNSIIKSRIPKFQPWKINLLKPYDIVIFCDAYWSPVNNINIWKNVFRQLIQSKNGILQSKNPYRNCAYDECKEIVRLKKDNPEKIIKTLNFFKSNNLPFHFGLWRNTFLCINMKNKNVKTLFDHLWSLYNSNTYTHRDQPLYSYSIFKTNIEPEEISEARVNVHNNYVTKQASINLFKITGKISNHTYN